MLVPPRCNWRLSLPAKLLFLFVLKTLHFSAGAVLGSQISHWRPGHAGASYLGALYVQVSRSPRSVAPGLGYLGSARPLATGDPKFVHLHANIREANVTRYVQPEAFAPSQSYNVIATHLQSHAAPAQPEGRSTPEAAAGQEEAQDFQQDQTPVSETMESLMENARTQAAVSRHWNIPCEDWRSKRQKQHQRRAQYLRSGRRFGSSTPPAPLNPSEKCALDERQATLEAKLDRMLNDTNVQVVVNQLENCRLSLEAKVSGEFTRQLWELSLTSLRASLRQSIQASPLDVSQAVLLQRAGGPAAVRRDVLRFMAEAILRKARMRNNARILGTVDFEEDLNTLADRFSPGTPLTLRLCAEAYPKVSFKRPYKGLKLSVPRQPYAKGNLFRLTEDYLLFKHAKIVDYPDPQPLTKEGDTVLLRVVRGWFEDQDGSMGPEIPAEYIHGPTTLHLVKPWIPTELLESVEGMAVGERRTIRVAIPFHTRQLLRICELQAENPQETPAGGCDMSQAGTVLIEKDASRPEGSSLVPFYLENIANKTKASVFAKLFGDAENSGEKADDRATMPLKSEDTGQSKETEEGESSLEGGADNSADEVHSIECLLEVECLGAKQRVAPQANDEFFMETCGMTRAQLWEKVESSGEALVTEAASKHALGAAAAALDEIAHVEIPESLIRAQAKATWKQQLKARELQGEDNSKISTKEGFLKWMEANKRGVETILKTSYTIQAICRAENLQVDEKHLQSELGKAMLQAPVESIENLTKQIYKKAQTKLVYDFIVKHANLEYYIDETPAQVTVETDGYGRGQHGVKAFPKGTDVEQWHKMREQTQLERDSLRNKAQRLFVDAKTLRKLDGKEKL